MLSSSESWEPQTAPTSLALACRWRSRPQHHKPTYAAQQKKLLDHLAGAREQHWRHVEAERFGRLQVENELELGRLLDRQIGGLLAAQDAIDVRGSLSVLVGKSTP